MEQGGRPQADQGKQQGVVVKLDRGFPLVRLEGGSEIRCEHAASLSKGTDHRVAIGDRVIVALPPGHDKGIIEETLPRTSIFIRKDPTERSLPQILAANFDLVLVAQPLEAVNIRRLERELVLAHETGVQVAVVLTKADLVTSPETVQVVLQQIDDLVGNDQVLVVSKDNPESIKLVARLIAQDNKTAVLLGRSGVGKSSLVNMLVGCDIQATTPVRERDGRGRHTTVSREIISLPSGGSIIDMPGIRGLALWDADEGIEATFSDIEELAQACRFRDCTHTTEPGCAVQRAVKNGSLTSKRLESYIRLREESKKMKTQREEATRIRTRLGHPRSRR